MLAILSNAIENANRLSDSLQCYWNSHGIYQSIALYEKERELLSSMEFYTYKGVILESISNPLELIPKIRALCPICKIAVVTNNNDPAKDNEMAIACYRLNIEMMLTRAEFEQPLAKLSKRLCVF